MNELCLISLIVIPVLAAPPALLSGGRIKAPGEAITLLGALATLAVSLMLCGSNVSFSIPWGAFGWSLSFRLYHFSGFIVIAASAFTSIICLYSLAFMRGKAKNGQFYCYMLITLAATNGAVLADNLFVLLVFWESLLLTLFGMIFIGGTSAYKTATKALIIVGASDLCLMFGIGLTAHLAGTSVISDIKLPMDFLGGAAFVFLVIGAASKAGSMPFHSWIPDSAGAAALPFMAFLPAALEKLLGIYLLARITLDMFDFRAGSTLSILLMTLGAVTILLAVLMALIQKEYKRLLSYHAISQVGYMMLGIGTAVPAGIVGGLFHMINHAMYKSCLFLTAGSVERQAGSTDLSKLGGLGARMPVTFACFIITAASISGVPPFNGFFSKELIYDAALEGGTLFYIAAVLGSFFTAASFIKLGHATFLGKRRPGNNSLREAPLPMLIPMIAIALGCVFFGIFNYLPIEKIIQPIAGAERVQGHVFSGVPSNIMIIVITLVVLVLAVLNHLFGFRTMGSALRAVEHIYHTPVLSDAYLRVEEEKSDPYVVGRRILRWASGIAYRIDRGTDWIYGDMAKNMAFALSGRLRSLQNGNYSYYIILSLVGAWFFVMYMLK